MTSIDTPKVAKAFRGDMPNSFDPNNAPGLRLADLQHIERRKRLLGPAYRLFYRTPVKIIRGQGVYLYDDQGNQYLDAYNNVVSLGHSNPQVVGAIKAQLDILCTHTRYMQDGLLDFAERLLGTFGGEIGRTGCVMFTCTGSEANDLALRVARHKTGKRGVIVTAEAYHGNSDAVAAISPSLGKHSNLDPFLRTVSAPDSYRVPLAEIGPRMAREVAAQIEDLQRRGDGIAAFIADSVFSSDGLYGNPTDILAPVADVVRKAGGLFIADEVQSGFGRTTEKVWGYQRHNVDPDIITMGKPMGNGYPVAGAAFRPDVVEGFGRDLRYFNTFGGNTVAIAAARATLDIILSPGLLPDANKVSRTLLEGLEQLGEKYEQIGDVRSAGIYYGIELVKDRVAKTTDIDVGLAIVNGLRDRRVLISATGTDANVLKIRPPLIFSEANCDQLLDALDKTLATI